MTMGQGPRTGGQPVTATGQHRPGQMTAVMRAMQIASGPKVLRIGLVQSGRVIEERIIKQRTTVTVGSNEKSMFVVQSQAIPPGFKLFELIGADYYLNFLDGMTGRVALATGISDLNGLRGQAKKVNNAYQVKLTEEARGKVVIGDTTFLFQFVAPPPPQPKPQLPLAVKGGLTSQIDWSLTILAAFSFLLHFGIVGAMYSDWMDPVVGDDFSINGIVDMMKSIPAPQQIEKDEKTDTSTTAKAEKAEEKKPTNTGPQKAAPSNQKVSDTKAAAMAQQADQMQMQMLASLAGGPATKGALDRSDIPPVDLTAAANAGSSVALGSGALKVAGGGAPVQGGKGGGLASLGDSKGAGGGTAGTGKDVGGPVAVANIGGTTATVPVSDADRVIAGLRGRFRSCYQAGLNSDPTMSGKVVISAHVSPSGEVDSATVASNTGLSPTVAQCIAGHVKRATFTPPGANGSTIQVPVTFVQQGK